MFVNKEVDVLSAKAHIAEAFKSCKTLKQENAPQRDTTRDSNKK